jgi:hypothetical protein
VLSLGDWEVGIVGFPSLDGFTGGGGGGHFKFL